MTPLLGFHGDRTATAPGFDEGRRERDAFVAELREALASVRAHRLWVALAVLLCLALAGLVAVLRPPVYLGTAQVVLDPRALRVTDNEILPGAASADVNDAVIDTQVRLLASDGVLSQVVDRLHLADDPEFGAGAGLLGRLIEALTGRVASRPADPAARAAAILAQRVVSQRQGKSFVVTTTARADDPAKAARIAAEVVGVFLGDLERRRRTTVAQARDAMAATLSGQRQRVAAAEDAVERYKAEHGIVDTDGRSLNAARLAELNSQLLVARNSTRTLAARLGQLEALQASGGAGGAGSDVVESALLTQLKLNRAEVMRQQENLKATLGARHPLLVEIEAQSRSLARAISGEIARLFASVRNDYKGALAREKALAEDVTRTEAETTGRNAALVELRQREREAVAQRSVYEKFLERERELREQEGLAINNASVVADPRPSTETVGLKPGLLLIGALLAGLLLGAGGAIALDRLRGRVHTPERFAERTGLDVVGTLPLSRLPPNGPASLPSLLERSGGSSTSRTLYGVADGLDAVAGAASLRLLVLSASDRPARSIVSINLALAQASRGRRTLLVDADSRTGRLGWLNPRRGPDEAVTTCLAEGFPPFNATSVPERERDDEEAAVVPVLHPTEGFERIVVDACGEMDELELRRHADAADAILIVAESGITPYGELTDLQLSLNRNAGKVLGALLVVPGRDRAIATRTRILTLPIRPLIAGQPRLQVAAA